PRLHNPAAQLAFDRGATFLQGRTNEGAKNAILEFQHAVALEPGWGEAWSGLADAYSFATNAAAIDTLKGMESARQAALRGIALNERLARAHGSLAQSYALDLDRWPEADKEFRRALELDPKDWEILLWHSVYLRKLGRFREAEEKARRGIE